MVQTVNKTRARFKSASGRIDEVTYWALGG